MQVVLHQMRRIGKNEAIPLMGCTIAISELI
jgi:hypothetical protein